MQTTAHPVPLTAPLIVRYRGRTITANDIAFLQQLIAESPGCSRRKLSERVCDAWGWV